MREKTCYLLFLSLLLIRFLAIPSWAQQEGEELSHILDQLNTAQKSIDDFTADITQVKSSSLFKEPAVSHGKMRFKRPNKIWVEMYPPYPNITVLNKGSLWIYFPEEKAAQRYHVAGNPHLAKWLLFFQNPIQTLGKRISLHEETTDEVVLNMDPAEDLAIFQEIRLGIDTSNWMLNRLELVEKNGDRTTITYHHIRINAGIPDSSFELHFPPDVDIIEPMGRSGVHGPIQEDY